MKKIMFGIVSIGLVSTLVAKEMFFNLTDLVNVEEKIKEEKILKNVEGNKLQNYNEVVSKLIQQRQTNFHLKKSKVIDIFVREDFNVLAETYVVKQPEHWIKVLVKEKDLWY